MPDSNTSPLEAHPLPSDSPLTVKFSCPKCGKRMSAAIAFAGKSSPCRKCGQQLTVPYESESRTPATANLPESLPAAAKSTVSRPTTVNWLAVWVLLVLPVVGFLLVLIVPVAMEAKRKQDLEKERKLRDLNKQLDELTKPARERERAYRDYLRERAAHGDREALEELEQRVREEGIEQGKEEGPD